MEQILKIWEGLQNIPIFDIAIAIGIIVFFKVFSATFSYMIIRIFDLKNKKVKQIKQNVLFKPLKLFFTILGIYLSVVFLKETLQINNYVFDIITKVFKIIVVLIFAKGLANSLNEETIIGEKIQKSLSHKMNDTMLDFALKIFRIFIYIIAIFVILAILEININGLIAGVGLTGVIVTLAAQDTAKNLFGGLAIFIDKPFSVGDWIQVENYEGTIEDITFRTTRIRTAENSIVTIPNAIIADSSVINWSRMEKRRYKTNLCIELTTPIEKLKLLQIKIEEMLKSRESVYDDSITVKFDKITEKAINILIYSYTNSIDYSTYLSEAEDINMKILKILREENINFAYDTKNVYIKS